MRGPIDYIIVGFEGNNFDGSILNSLVEPLEKGIIKLIALSAVSRDKNDNLIYIDVEQSGNKLYSEFIKKYKPEKSHVDVADLSEIGELIQKNTTAGFLVVEQLWALPLKVAIIKANGVLLAEGRIHPDAEKELEDLKGGK